MDADIDRLRRRAALRTGFRRSRSTPGGRVHWRALVLAACVSTWLGPAMAQAAGASPAIDLAHYWISPGERAALDIFKQAFVEGKGAWSESVSDDYEFMKRDVVGRIAVGLAPSALWWGAEDRGFTKLLDFLRPIDQIAPAGWAQHLNATAMELIGAPGKARYLPITIHNENWSWYNARVYRKLGLPLPVTWAQFLRQAPVLAAEGIVPLAVSDQPWTVRLLWTTIVAGVAGRELYLQLLVNANTEALDDPRMQRALRTFLELRRWSSRPGTAPTWADATAQVREGRAAMQVMGDWARAEFPLVDVSAQSDYVCAPAPNAAGLFIAAVDMFAFPSASTNLAGQALLARVVLRPDVQVRFANQKGATPVLRNLDAQQLHPCARQTYALLQSPNAVVQSHRATLFEGARVRVMDAVDKHWRTSSTTLSDFTADLRSAFQRGDRE